MARRIDTVRIQTGDQLVEIAWKTSQRLRRMLIGAGLGSIERRFADKGTRAPVVLYSAEKQELLGIVRVCMTESDERACELLPLRDALLGDLGMRSKGRASGDRTFGADT
jgi:hypothetical protein